MVATPGPRQEFPARPDAGECFVPPRDSGTISDIVDSIGSEFEIVMGRPERVHEECARLHQVLSALPASSRLECLLRLPPFLRMKAGALAAPLFALLEESCWSVEDPWPLLRGMLVARDRELVVRALDLAAQLVQAGSIHPDDRMALFISEQAESEESPLVEPSALSKIEIVLKALPRPWPEGADPVHSLYLSGEQAPLRRLAARVLDLEGQPASADLAEAILGKQEFAFLHPYLEYTRASHLDLLHLAPKRGMLPPALPSLIHAQQICGDALLRDVIARVGWAHVNLGLDVRQYCGISIGGSFPAQVFPTEAPLLESHEDARRVSESFIILALGGLPSEVSGEISTIDPVARFRALNLIHAEVLSGILDLAPLTHEKVLWILERMDRIVADFCALFSSHTEETAILPGLYLELKQRILSELQKETSPFQLSPELTRLVQMFEDPANLGAVRTLHGLKRYLHQRGLRLGIRLIQGGRGTNRTVDILHISKRGILRAARDIRYVDFEPDPEAGDSAAGIPYPVAALLRGFARQLLYGHESFPSVEVFCYGNEVHYYLSFRNHPAFLRIDFSPPLQGGMIDLEYYGVSKYDLSVHPNPSLDVVRLFFQRLEFDVQIESTRVHACYDKERALDLGDICEKAEGLFALVPYLLDVDWIVGSLQIDTEARRKVAEAWADRFVLWGALPIAQLLTADRQMILLGIDHGPAGVREIPWPGDGPYQDRFADSLPHALLEQYAISAKKLGLEFESALEMDRCRPLGQIRLERCILHPLRKAVARGEVIASTDGHQSAPAGSCGREHEAVKFAEILDSEDESVASSVTLAQLLVPLERSLRFCTTGSVNGHEVQRARLPLHGESLGLYVLRDHGGIIRLALFTRDEGVYCRRDDTSEPWKSNISRDASAMASLLRRCNYVVTGSTTSPDTIREAHKLREYFRGQSGTWRPVPEYGERIVYGSRAAPGCAVGRVLFGTEHRSPGDFDGGILVDSSVRPEDNTFLYHSAGIVSTGGGVLSHAGLLAIQFRKPALVISGQWIREADRSTSLIYRVQEYREEESELHGARVTIRRDLHYREFSLREGDFVVLDADAGALRILGQDPQTLALHEGFRSLAEANSRLAHAGDPVEILVLRGNRLRACHQIEKLLSRLTDPILARHALRELLLRMTAPGSGIPCGDRARFLSRILLNPSVAVMARQYQSHIAADVERQYAAASARAEQDIPTSAMVYEILELRMHALRLLRSLDEIEGSMRACGIAPPRAPSDGDRIESAARLRLGELRRERFHTLQRCVVETSDAFRLRQLLRQVDQFDALLGPPDRGDRLFLTRLRNELDGKDREALRRLDHRLVLQPEECGFALFPLIGWKAANLAEVAGQGGRGLVPPWFAITNVAFEQMLDMHLDKAALEREGVPANQGNLREAIGGILARTDIETAQKSVLIRCLWNNAIMPRALSDEVVGAYRRLVSGREKGGDPREDSAGAFVAIRSSAREEDAESAARAGEFETYLFIRGEEGVLRHLKKAWSGLWTERAIHNRAVLGSGLGKTGGGIIVQRMVSARVSGVLQTVNIAEGEAREIVVNAGLGLGEGIVSGLVAADHIVIDKEADPDHAPVRFRYITGDKRERVVFNKRAGCGTVREETLYHQRLRPALEYVELCELVRTALFLEERYGYPLDIEFAVEGTRLWILQARPVVASMTSVQETLSHFPLDR